MITKNELISSTKTLLEDINNSFETCPVNFNLLDIGNMSEKENTISAYITFLLDREKGCKRNDFDTLFLDMLRQTIPGLEGTKISYIEREKTITNQRRIDVYVKTNKNEIIIIENKVWAEDQPNQLIDYYNWSIQANQNATTYMVYLTPHGHQPSNYSIPTKLLTKLILNKQFTTLSYETDIINLLSDIENKIDDNEKYLKSGVLQLKDSIAGFCGEREDDKIKEKMIMNNIFEQYKDVLESKNADSSYNIMELANTIRYEAEAISILRFLNDVTDELKSLNIENEIYFTHGQDRIKLSDKERFYNLIKENPESVGVEVSLGHDNLGIGVEFSEINSNSTITFGLMSHTEDNNKASQKYSQNDELSTKIKLDYNNTILTDSWWWEYVEFNSKSWLHKGLFYQSDWQKVNGSLASHITKNWILPVIEVFNTI